MSDPIGGERLWDADPDRGCGRKQHDSFYLESGPGSPNGSLSLVTLCTGDLQIGGENILCNIPPRGSHVFYPIDTLRLGEVQFAAAHVGTPDDRKTIEQIATNGTKAVGIVDHVGSNNYSPVQFIRELHEYGASRRVTREMADKVLGLMNVGFTSIPIFFTHAHIPLLSYSDWFRSMMLIESLFSQSTASMYQKASYTHPTWGMRRQKWGGIWESQPAAAYYILELANAAAQADDSRYAAAKSIFDRCAYKEQLLCSSWTRAVCYVTRTGDVPNGVMDGGYTILDLSKQKDEEE